jgi:hypothetical protein
MNIVDCNYINDIEIFFSKVMIELEYSNWKLQWMNGDAYCWRKNKTIDICPMDSYDECCQMLLHEISHIDIIEDGNQHTERFFNKLESLVEIFMGCKLNVYQQEMKRIYVDI